MDQAFHQSLITQPVISWKMSQTKNTAHMLYYLRGNPWEQIMAHKVFSMTLNHSVPERSCKEIVTSIRF